MLTRSPEGVAAHGAWPTFRPSDRLRVLHVVPALNGGGMERTLIRLLKHSTGYPSRWPSAHPRLEHGVCILQGGDRDLINRCRAYAQVWVLSDSPAGSWAFVALRQIIRSFGPHVVHARTTAAWPDATLATFGLRHTALVLGFHGREHLGAPSWARRCVNAWAAHQADCVLTVSHSAAVELEEQYNLPLGKLRTIANGVDSELFHPAIDSTEVLATRAALGLGPADLVVVCTANLLPIKAHDVLLRAWATVTASLPAARLLLIGNGPLRSELQDLARELRVDGSVRFLGDRGDVPALLRAADLFVLPSRYEGCSNAALEAMATSLPVIGTDIAGMRELVVPNRTGWLVAPDDPAALADAITAAFRDPAARKRAGHAGRAAAAGCFGVEAWTRDYARLYGSLRDTKTGRAATPAEGLACAG